jgi:hypothetical protein
MITENDITFENDVYDNSVHWQEIHYKNKCIGAIGQKDEGFLKPIKEWYQCIVPESYINILSDYYEAEDEGYVFAIFHNLSDFINFINNKEKLK